MREFSGADGTTWHAYLHDGDPAPGDLLRRVGWEIVVFLAPDRSGDQRFVHRPAGWLRSAGSLELAVALAEAEHIRTVWAPSRG
jgi:hypothetical protein